MAKAEIWEHIAGWLFDSVVVCGSCKMGNDGVRSGNLSSSNLLTETSASQDNRGSKSDFHNTFGISVRC